MPHPNGIIKLRINKKKFSAKVNIPEGVKAKFKRKGKEIILNEKKQTLQLQ